MMSPIGKWSPGPGVDDDNFNENVLANEQTLFFSFSIEI